MLRARGEEAKQKVSERQNKIFCSLTAKKIKIGDQKEGSTKCAEFSLGTCEDLKLGM